MPQEEHKIVVRFYVENNTKRIKCAHSSQENKVKK